MSKELCTCTKCTVVWDRKRLLVGPTESEEGWCPRCIAKKRLQYLRFQMKARRMFFDYYIAAAQLAAKPEEAQRHLGVAHNHVRLFGEMEEALDNLLVME